MVLFANSLNVNAHFFVSDEERDMCLAIALSIQGSAADPTTASHDCSGAFSFTRVGDPSSHASEPSVRCLPTSRCCGHPLMMCDGHGSTLWCADQPYTRPLRHRCSPCCSSRCFDYSLHQPSVSDPPSVLAAVAAASSSYAESVFEPRPSHQIGAAVERCALAHDETVTVLDPWRRRPSSFDHGRPSSYRCVLPPVEGKSNAVSGRRRSCGTRLLHHRDHGSAESDYPALATCSVPDPLRNASGPGDASTGGSEVSNDLAAPVRRQDTIDLVISSEILESMLQGTAGYVVGGNPACNDDECQSSPAVMPETVELSPEPDVPSEFVERAELQPDNHADDDDAVFV